jgi:predicted nuclease with RNAse H fold
VLTLGIDLSASNAKTGVARIEWSSGRATVKDVRVGATDQELVHAIDASDKAGIDCPLGWPEKFIRFIDSHYEDHVVVDEEALAADRRRELSYRATDLRVKKEVAGIQGLSVSTDRIGVTTMRCAALLAALAGRGSRVDRTGAGRVVEVYPAASLKVWGLPHKGYKAKAASAARAKLVEQLASSGLDMGGFEEICRSSDDALDAVVASVTARAVAVDAVHLIPPEYAQAAQREGWIAVPAGHLSELLNQL